MKSGCIHHLIAGAWLLAQATSWAITSQDLTSMVTVPGYSNWMSRLYTSLYDSRGFTETEPGGTRIPGAEHDLARDFILDSFNAMGYTTRLDPFAFTEPNGPDYAGCNNIIAQKTGSGGTNLFIIGAHYDTYDFIPEAPAGAPGADDNASGVAAVLEIARILQPYQIHDTILFIAFDAEEIGSFGSQHFVETQLTNDPSLTNTTTFLRSAVKGMISIDTIARNSDNVVGIFNASEETNSALHRALAQATTQYSSNLPVHDGNMIFSDHTPFALVGIDAVTLNENEILENPYMHTANDHVENPGHINYPYAVENTKAVLGYLCNEARIIPPATLSSHFAPPDRLQLSWESTPHVAYTLQATDSLMPPAIWSNLTNLPATHHPALMQVELNTSASSQQLFRVESYHDDSAAK